MIAFLHETFLKTKRTWCFIIEQVLQVTALLLRRLRTDWLCCNRWNERLRRQFNIIPCYPQRRLNLTDMEMSLAAVISDAASVEDLCWGLTFFGTGGGGRIEAGLDLLAPVVASGESLALTDPAELADDALVCWAVIVGGKDPDEPPLQEELDQFGLVREAYPTIVPRLAAAVRELEAHTGKAVDALVSLELSSAATVATIMTARELGIKVLDCDFVGRAIPELPLTKLELLGHAPVPVVMLDRWGNRTIIQSAVGTPMVDRLGRMLSRAAYGRGIATVGNLMSLGQARHAFVRGSLHKAMAVGAALRLGAANGESLAKLQPLMDVTQGMVLARGEVTAVDWRDTQPYAFRELSYRIADRSAKPEVTVEIWVKNEHHIVWRNGRVIATSPDIVAILDEETNRPLTTLGDVVSGQRVVVVAMSALDPIWHTPAGEALLGPRHFGFDFDAAKLD